ncbi:MAG TPA: sensor histidine kinase [Lacunisphaera sp.]|jgi:signal transduction histidine kinase
MTNIVHRHTGRFYRNFAFASVILACFASLSSGYHYHNSGWLLLATVVLGSVYTAISVLGSSLIEERGPTAHAIYFGVQCAVVTLLIAVSPIRGFFGIIVLPLVSQSIFDLRPRNATLVCVYLFAINIALWALTFGWAGAREALIDYSTGFAFTIVFTIITRRALQARAREQKLREEVESANRQLRDYAEQAGDLATTRERNRVAREIHDGVGHYLTVIKTQLDAAATLLPTQPGKARESILKAASLSGEALDDVRRSVGALRADTGRPPLPEALKELVAQGSPIPTFAVEGAPRPLTSTVEHALFRAAQEGLTNIRKHARATSALLILDFRIPQRIRLELSDNGVGTIHQPPGAGFGLTGLRERIELLGGQVETANRLDGGFALTVEVPA